MFIASEMSRPARRSTEPHAQCATVAFFLIGRNANVKNEWTNAATRPVFMAPTLYLPLRYDKTARVTGNSDKIKLSLKFI